jgi:hypothetical protein
MIIMKFDEREAPPIIFIGDGSTLLKHVVEEGDEAVLYHDGKLVMARISSLKGNQMLGRVTRYRRMNLTCIRNLLLGKRYTFSKKTSLAYLK